jgi:hypothetical protein
VCHGYDSICQGGLQFPYFVRYEAVRVDAEPLKCVAVLILVKLLREVNSDTSPFLLLRATLIWNNVWVCAIGFPDRTTLSPPDQGPNLILVVTFVPVLLIKSLEEQMEYREETWDNHKKCCFGNYLGSGTLLVKRWSSLASRSEHRSIRPDGEHGGVTDRSWHVRTSAV